ncbi:histidine phosphatase family protein [Metabacillus sediminilitoris]|uniref:Histidine phosphatase family protein n=1 Tax=Metabacillus sediminilitoris TaxID=2567941 RepID=A0A4S4BJL5_9BACI|nr:histidine phosphatase family protein [Metabacillus sediminilitoris]QGQ45749.1 histidine phosphatase family protein [Metabacillus sediminilitoris]THF74869.1 histidine phosphatase family protein [Metabacillus sediminilitoris]
MEISLIRHGKSLWTVNNPITCKEFKDWIENYDCNGVYEENSYPPETIKTISNAKVVITSDLKRSIDSARYLNPNIKTISDPLFREIEFPIPPTKLWGVKLNPNTWAVFLRCLWFSGYSSGCESLNDAKNRAKKASKRLVVNAKENDVAVLVGHGFFNMMIAKELQKLGWIGYRKISSKHWHSTTYSFK